MKANELMIGFKYIPQYEGLYSIDKNGNVFSHISGMASRELGISVSSICNCIKGLSKTSGGFIWRF